MWNLDNFLSKNFMNIPKSALFHRLYNNHEQRWTISTLLTNFLKGGNINWRQYRQLLQKILVWF